MSRNLPLVAAAIPLVALLFVACGGTGSGTPKTTAVDTSAAAVQSGPDGRVIPQCVDLTTSPPPSKDFPPSANPAANIPESQRNQVNLVVAGLDFYAGGENNFVFAITNKQDLPQGGAKVRVTIYDLKDPTKPAPYCQGGAIQSAPGVGPERVHVHGDGSNHTHGGQDQSRVAYYIRVKFSHAGGWGIAAETILSDGTKGTASVGFDVAAKPGIPAPGMPALKSDNLTKKDVTKISEIDSGEPANDMHEVKIKDAIAAGRPLVIVFATPAFCTSRFCGPVTDEVATLNDKYKDKVDFVHIEIWRDFASKSVNTTAREWLIRPDGNLTEPYVYVIDKNGIIYDRFEGPAAANLLEPEVQALIAGATYQ